MPRERHVFDTDMVPHLWAQQEKSDARNQRGNLFFRGPTIFSYGEHFPIARFYVNKRGEKCVLHTSLRYSATTAGHCHSVRLAAIRSMMEVFTVQNVADSYGGEISPVHHTENLEAYAQQIIDIAKQAQRARSNKIRLTNSLVELIAEANAYSAFFRLRRKFKLPADIDIEKMLVEGRLAAAAENARQAEACRNHVERVAAETEEWKRNERHSLSREVAKVYLRVIVRENNSRILQTSKGAQVPLRQVLRLVPLVRSDEMRGQEVDIRVGYFIVTRVDSDGITAGCHVIDRDEIERIVATLDPAEVECAALSVQLTKGAI